MESKYLNNPHPGTILKEEFLGPLDIKIEELADAISILEEDAFKLILGELPVTPELDLRLCKLFGISNGSFLRLQQAYDMEEVNYAS